MAFVKFMDLKEPITFSMEFDVLNKIFIDLHISARKFLRVTALAEK